METNTGRIEIPLSKSKITFLLLLAVGFVVGGVSFIINPSEFADTGVYHRPSIEVSIVGYICTVFFGAGGVILAYKLFDKKPGLRLDDEGITINPGTSAPIIRWKDIQKFEITNVSRTKIIQVYLKDPQVFIAKLDGSFKKKMAEFSLRTYGTPVSISTSALKCNTEELFQILTTRLRGDQ